MFSINLLKNEQQKEMKLTNGRSKKWVRLNVLILNEVRFHRRIKNNEPRFHFSFSLFTFRLFVLLSNFYFFLFERQKRKDAIPFPLEAFITELSRYTLYLFAIVLITNTRIPPFFRRDLKKKVKIEKRKQNKINIFLRVK